MSKKVAGPRLRLAAPVLGGRRMPADDLVAQRDAVDRLLAAATAIERGPEGIAARVGADLVADVAMLLIEDATGEDFAAHRSRLAGLARIGFSLAVAEDRTEGSVVGLTLPAADTALLYLALENRAGEEAADDLVKTVTDFALEAGYYVGRTNRAVPTVLAALVLGLPALFPGRMAQPAPSLPAQRQTGDHDRAWIQARI